MVIWRYQIFYGLLFFSSFFAWHTVKKKYGWIAFVLLSWVLIDAVMTYQMPAFTTDVLSLRLRLVSARSFCQVAMVTYFMTQLRPWHLVRLFDVLELFTFANCSVYLWQGYGAFNAGSMDMAFLAMIYPAMVFKDQRIFQPWFVYFNPKEGIYRALMITLPLIALCTNRPGSTVFMALALGFSAYITITKKWESWLVIFPLALMFVGFHMNLEAGERTFFDNSGRFGPWTEIMSWWANNANFWTGTGSGTFQWLGPMIQNRDDRLMVWLHQDYLQALFEQGIIGFGLMLYVTLMCFIKSFKTPWLFACMVSTFFVMNVQFPLRFLASQIFILLLVRLAYDRESREFMERVYWK